MSKVEIIPFSFEPFAETLEYQEANAPFIQKLGELVSFPANWRLLDIATGVGTMARLVNEQLKGCAQVVGLDASADAIKIALDKLVSLPVQFVQALAQKLPLRGNFHLALFGNGIHNLSHEDKKEALREAFLLLESGGVFAFNTAFYEGCFVPGTESFYRSKVVEAVKIIRREYPQITRSEEGRAPARDWLSPQQYVDLATSVGFNLLYSGEREVKIYLPGWRAICQYGEYAAGALHGYPVAVACQALMRAVEIALEKLGWSDEGEQKYIPRRWFEATLLKPA